MPMALPSSNMISQASQGTTEYKIIEINYGNGYSQRARDGLNSNQATWNVVWENLNNFEYMTLINVLDSANGVETFTWTAPGTAGDKKWIIGGYQLVATSGELYTVSATMKQVFDL